MYRRTYADRTKVSVEKSRSEIENLPKKRGATAFLFGEAEGQIMLMFQMRERRLKFLVPMPQLTRSTTENKVKQEARRRFRALALVLKAKLEAVDSKIVEFEHEFLAHIVFDGTTTVGERMVSQMQAALSGRSLPPLLSSGDGVTYNRGGDS